MKGAHFRWALPLVLITVWLVYHPALNRVFTADQVWYFAELNGSTSLLEGLRRVDYSASRHYWKGDESLFRPLLFTWLALENTLFSYHHVWWNLANLLIHGLVVFFLLRLLVAIHPSWWAFPAALLFGVLKPPLELVAWNHLGGYLLACLFFSIGLRAFVEILQGESPRRGAAITFALSFTVAGLFYESMVPISMLAAVVITTKDRLRGRGRSAGDIVILFAPPVIYAAFYLIHVQQVPRLFYVDNPDAAAISVAGLGARDVINAVHAVRVWSLELLFPSALSVAPSPFDRFQLSFAFNWASSASLAALTIVATGLAAAARATSWTQFRNRVSLLIVLVGSLLLYALVICLGRPLSLVLSSGYYPYFPCLVLIVAAYSLIDFGRLRGWSAMLGGMALASLIAMHAAGTYAVTREVARQNSAPSRLLTRVGRFVDAHKAEPGFTFTIRAHLQSLDPQIALRRGYPDDPAAPTDVRRFTEIIFKRYYDDASPKYVFEQSEQ